MEVCGHDHIRIDPEMFLLDTEIQTIGDDFAGSLIDEYGQPFNHTEGDII